MKLKEIRGIFYGTSDFGLPALAWLFEHTRLVAIVTTPDMPAGRQQLPAPSPVKKWAVAHQDVILFQPRFLKNEYFEQALRHLSPDLAVTASYGKIIPKNLLEIPARKTLNLHPSLLPKYRGASPVQTAVLNGDKITGTTLMLMDEELDHGPILAQKELAIQNGETAPDLRQRLAVFSADLLAQTLPKYLAGQLRPRPQDHTQATLTWQFHKEDGHIDWTKSAEEIERMTRALNPWPGTFTNTNLNKTIKIYQTSLSDEKKYQPGEVGIETKKIFVGTGSTDLEILELQMAGGNRMSAENFVTGFRGALNFTN